MIMNVCHDINILMAHRKSLSSCVSFRILVQIRELGYGNLDLDVGRFRVIVTSVPFCIPGEGKYNLLTVPKFKQTYWQ